MTNILIPINYKKSVLPNGLRILSNELTNTNGVSINFLFGAGSRYEQEFLSGASHLFEHVLFKGTKNRPDPKKISSEIENVGGIINAFTDKEITGYWSLMPFLHYKSGIEVIADMIQNSLLKNEDIDNEKKVIYEEIKASIDSPASKVQMNLESKIWPNQPMGRDIAGTVESVSKISKKEMFEYLKSQYVSSNTVISIAGNIIHEDVVDLIEKNMRDFQKNNIQKMFPFINNFKGPEIIYEKRDTQQTNISLGFQGISYHNKNRFALSLLSVILGESMSSRLFTELREKRALAYDIHSSCQYFSDCGIFSIEAGIAPEKLYETIKIIISEVSKISHDLTQKEVDDSITLSLGRMMLRMENSRSISNYLGTQELLKNHIETPDEIIKKIKSVSLNDIKKISNDIINTKSMVLSIIGPKCNEEEIYSLLR